MGAEMLFMALGKGESHSLLDILGGIKNVFIAARMVIKELSLMLFCHWRVDRMGMITKAGLH